MNYSEPHLHILRVSTTDTGGGAQKTAWKLFQAFNSRGNDSWLAVGYKYSKDPRVLEIPNYMLRNLWTYWKKPGNGLRQTKSLAAELYHGVLNIPVDCRRAIDICRGIEDFNFPGTYHLLKLPPRRPDILHCHNLHGGYFDLRALPCLSAEVPTVLTLHDAWLLSGHCAHSFDCDLWKTGCDKCPDLTIYPPIQRDAAAYNWRRKREIYARSRLYVATASRWLMSKIEQSILSQAIVESRVIPNGAELDIFHPADKRAVRAELKMPQDAKIILSVANKIKKNMFKDFHTMQTAISTVAEQFPGQNILLFAVGDSAPPERIGKVEVSFIPFLEDRKMIARFYQAADVYIHTARVETFGNTVMEALACGTPVVATGVGGIPEQVEDNVSGFLVPPAHPEMMAARIQQLLSDDELRLKMGGNAAESARLRFDLNRQVNDYLLWYHEILEHRTRKRKSI